jgi:hypothetical protein
MYFFYPHVSCITGMRRMNSILGAAFHGWAALGGFTKLSLCILAVIAGAAINSEVFSQSPRLKIFTNPCAVRSEWTNGHWERRSGSGKNSARLLYAICIQHKWSAGSGENSLRPPIGPVSLVESTEEGGSRPPRGFRARERLIILSRAARWANDALPLILVSQAA